MSVASSALISREVREATRQIARRDPAMAVCIARVGPALIRPGLGDYFSALARAIAYQQLDGKAGMATHGRFVDSVGGRVTPEAVMATPVDALRGAGLSAAKTVSIR